MLCLAESARGLALGRGYACRLLRRYRPTLPREDRQRLLDRLVRGYPAHSFIVHREEAGEVGLPIRAPDLTEATLLDQLALAPIEFGAEEDLIAFAGAPREVIATTRKVLRSMKMYGDRKEAVTTNRGRTRRWKKEGR
jgi:hypothetical protein